MRESEDTDIVTPGLGSPDDIQQRSMALLEWPRVLEMLAGQTHFFRARELALETEPARDERTVERLQDETSEARLLLDQWSDIGLTGSPDVRPLLQRASLDGVLEGRELAQVARLCQAMWQARASATAPESDVPRLGAVATQILDMRWLAERVDEAIDPNGYVRDTASPRLGGLRADVSRRYRRLANLLERIMGRPSVRPAIQSPVIATRGDRLVLEVRADRRNALPGIVHDVSNTGATLFVEPFDAVDQCNEWREAASEVEREEQKVLRNLSRLVGQRRDDIEIAIGAAGALDLMVARGRLAGRMDAARARTLPPGHDPALELTEARHPLLGPSAVPVDMSLGPGFRSLVITGPNTGGKTVALKTAGLLALMHQAGMQAPADARSGIAVFGAVYADIGDAQSIERSVSTFSSHISAVIQVMEGADSESLVLLDELGTGTDPVEGAALAQAVLDDLLDRNVPTIVTTHHRSVAEHAGETRGMANASVELDPDTMLPTYRVVMGIPGRSYAMEVGQRLGLPERVLERARGYLSPEHAASERLLLQLQRERDSLHQELETARRDHAAAEEARRDLEQRLAEIRESQDELVEQTRAELERQAEDVRADLRRVLAQARNEQDIAAARREAERVRRSIRRPDRLKVTRPVPRSSGQERSGEAPAEEQPAPERRELQPGDVVEVRGLSARGNVVERHEDETVTLMMGNARVTLNETQLKLVKQADQVRREQQGLGQAAGGENGGSGRGVSISTPVVDNPSRELDIRGARAHEAHDRVTAFLDQAALLGLGSARIIHGRGTGALREATRDALRRHPSVEGFHNADPQEGGDGATEVTLT